jgi:hypothetical protein
VTRSAERAQRFARVEQEVAREKAAALGRAGERLEAALAETAALARALAEAGDGDTRARLADEYEAARRRAQTARTALLIQREALGLRQHRVVDQHFPEPPRLP